MAAKHSSATDTRTRAKKVASGGTGVRDRVRDLSVGAFRDGEFSLRQVPKFVHEVLEGAVEGVDASIPKSSKSVLREVFDGLSEGVQTVASAGSAAAGGVQERGRAIAGKTVPHAAARIRAANEEFLGAVKSFAGTASKHVREELDSLVARAERTGPKVVGSARKVAKAADGRLLELTGETARASVLAARRAAGALAMGAGGLFEGLAEAIRPKGVVAAPKRGKSTSAAKKGSAKKGSKKKAAPKRRKA